LQKLNFFQYHVIFSQHISVQNIYKPDKHSHIFVYMAKRHVLQLNLLAKRNRKHPQIPNGTEQKGTELEDKKLFPPRRTRISDDL